MQKPLLLILLCCIFSNLLSQEIAPLRGGKIYVEKVSNCVSDEQRIEINRMLAQNIAALTKAGVINPQIQKPNATTAFAWPLQKSNGLSFNSYYATNNYVDQNTGAGLLDYNCGARTYEGHTGTDIDTWPFPWYMYNNDFVEVIAGESGIIIGKSDGNDDTHCSCSGNWNAVYVQHSDGSVAWYGHMKKNSLTFANVGDAVSKGDYLGLVASSGCSTQPHLHFEVHDASNHLIDPYSGVCNSLNGDSWWASQPADREPTLNALLTHSAIPVHGCPGASEVTNISNAFTPEQVVYTGTYYHDALIGDVSNLTIVKPDNTIWQSWTHTSLETSTRSWWVWGWYLPPGGPFGTWQFEVEYQGQLFKHAFEYQSSLPVELIYFKARKKQPDLVQLSWESASETRNSGFELEKSGTGKTWEKLAYIPGAGSAKASKSYQYLDRKPYQGINYYRLKQIDFDGKTTYSDIISVAMETAANLSIAPNPANTVVYLSGSAENQIKVYDVFGSLLIAEKNVTQIDISDLPKGVYLFSVDSETGSLVKKIIKNQ